MVVGEEDQREERGKWTMGEKRDTEVKTRKFRGTEAREEERGEKEEARVGGVRGKQQRKVGGDRLRNISTDKCMSSNRRLTSVVRMRAHYTNVHLTFLFVNMSDILIFEKYDCKHFNMFFLV